MGNPVNPAPLEDVAAEYIAKAAESLGVYGPTSPELDIIAKTYFKSIYRGLWHFLEDHMFVEVDSTLISVEGSPVEVFNKFITVEDSAWKNEV